MKVVVIEDDPDVIEVVSVAFETTWPGTKVVNAPNGTDGLELVKVESPDVVILDVGLPEGDTYGFELCREIRTFSTAPIIMLTVRSREVDVVRGLELGASDYVTKPFSPVELLARSRAVLRRVQMGPLGTESQPFISKSLSVDFETREVMVQGTPVKLTPTEYRLLCYLIRNAHQILPSRSILAEVWGDGYTESGDLVKGHIQRLRKKLNDDSRNPRLIVNERGRGYRFAGAQ